MISANKHVYTYIEHGVVMLGLYDIPPVDGDGDLLNYTQQQPNCTWHPRRPEYVKVGRVHPKCNFYHAFECWGRIFNVAMADISNPLHPLCSKCT